MKNKTILAIIGSMAYWLCAILVMSFLIKMEVEEFSVGCVGLGFGLVYGLFCTILSGSEENTKENKGEKK